MRLATLWKKGRGMAKNQRAHLTTQPDILNLGSNYVSARIQGSLQVLGANSCDRFDSRE